MNKKTPYHYRDWYRTIIESPDKIFEALEWFRDRQSEARELILPVEGNLVELNTYHAGYLAIYTTYFKQLVHIADYFEHKLKRINGLIIKEWRNNPQTVVAPSATEMKFIVEDDERYSDMKVTLGEIQVVRDEMDAIVAGFETRSYQIKNNHRS